MNLAAAVTQSLRAFASDAVECSNPARNRPRSSDRSTAYRSATCLSATR